MTLSKLDIAALRKCDAVVFFSDFSIDDSRGYPVRNYSGSIRAIKRADTTKDPFATDQYYEFDVNKVDLANYDSKNFKPTRASSHLTSSEFHDHWRTITGMLRVGDELCLSWVASNNNEYLTNAGLHHDCLDIQIIRKGKVRTFRVDDSICPNNSARMFQ